MPVTIDQTTGLIHLYNDQISYVIQLLAHRYPIHRYFGRRLTTCDHLALMPQRPHAFAADATPDFPYSVTSLPFEYATIGSGDYRQPGYLIKDTHQQWLPLLTYQDLTVTHQPLNPAELPTTVAATEPVTTLQLHLSDPVTALNVDLNYTIFEQRALLLRSTTFHNNGLETLSIDHAASLQLALPTADYRVLTLAGTHAHEANLVTAELHPGIQLYRSLRGTSGPQQQPFTALTAKSTTEFSGEVLASALVWSGNFESSVEVDQYGRTRFTLGLEPTTFSWQLKPQQSFQTPEAVLTWSDQGLNGLSQNWHAFAQQLLPDVPAAPLVLNTWETMMFDVSAAKVTSFIEQAASFKLATVVIDDGWFTNRHGEHGQLGDWEVDRTKFPAGLAPLSTAAHQLGLKFGLWVEPEMVTMNSHLYQQHPDWVLRYIDRDPITARHQLVLDLSQSVVRQYLLTTLIQLVKTNQLDYLKWDFNRHLAQVGNTALPSAQQGELSYRYVLGLYDLLRRLRAACPELVIENCSAGGGRLDFGLLTFTPQTWLSDLTDPIDRATIENGFSYLFPPTVFSNHVSASPNAQNGRQTTLITRLNLNWCGQLGFELELKTLSNKEQDQLRQQIAAYKTWYPALRTARFYRLLPSGTAVAWLIISADAQQAILFYSPGLSSAVKTTKQLPLRYLPDERTYALADGTTYLGAELNQFGLPLTPSAQDFTTQLIKLHAVTQN